MLSREIMMLLFWLPDPPPDKLKSIFDKEILTALILNHISANIVDAKSKETIRAVSGNMFKSALQNAEKGGK